jgi:hypothetical protein
MRRWAALVLVGMIRCGTMQAQQGAGAGVDAEIVAASLLVGKGLFLRGFYLNNDLTYDAAGRVQGSPKVGDWTVAAVNVLKAERRGADEIELDGVRVAIRYNSDTHEFQRHSLNDEKMRLVVKGLAGKDAGNTKQLEAGLRRCFLWGSIPHCSGRCRTIGGTISIRRCPGRRMGCMGRQFIRCTGRRIRRRM